MRRAPRSRVSPPTLRTSLMSSLTMTMRHQLHLRESRGMITLTMTHQLGAATKVGIDLHSSTFYILSVHCISMFRFLFTLLFSFSFLLSKTQKDQKYFRCFSLFVSTFGLLYLLFSVCYLKNPKIFCFVCYFLSFLFQKSKTPKIFVVFLWFCKVCCRVQSPVTLLELGIHFILFNPYK
jgi:hypothetical protein